MNDTSGRAFVLGLDGIPWRLIEEWATAGELPNFQTLLADGATGPLESTTPASTPLAWPSIATGVWPDQHGIYSFQNVTPEYTHEMYTREDIQSATIWEMLSPAVVGNVPMTYPAGEIDGKMVAGMMAPELNERYTHPPELAAEIDQQLPEYEISLDWSEYVDDEQRIVDDVTALLAARRTLMRWLMETDDWRLFFFTYTEPDRLQHLVWDREILLEFYTRLDSILGEVMEYVRAQEATLFVVSDHGFGPISKRIAPNAVLEREQYLSPAGTDGTQGILDALGITKSTIRSALDAVGIDEEVLIKQYLPQAVVDRIASSVPGSHFLYDLDHGQTRAFAHEFGNVYINDTARFSDGCVDPAEKEPLKERLSGVFRSLTDPATGEQVLDVRDGDTVFPRDDWSPDLVLKPRPEYAVSFSMTEQPVFEPNADADHRSDGIFLAWGPSIAAGSTPEEASVVDVTPTVVHTCGEPVPANADGRVLDEIYSADTDPCERDVETAAYDHASGSTTSEEDMEKVEERLQGLGYME